MSLQSLQFPPPRQQQQQPPPPPALSARGRYGVAPAVSPAAQNGAPQPPLSHPQPQHDPVQHSVSGICSRSYPSIVLRASFSHSCQVPDPNAYRKLDPMTSASSCTSNVVSGCLCLCLRHLLPSASHPSSAGQCARDLPALSQLRACRSHSSILDTPLQVVLAFKQVSKVPGLLTGMLDPSMATLPFLQLLIRTFPCQRKAEPCLRRNCTDARRSGESWSCWEARKTPPWHPLPPQHKPCSAQPTATEMAETAEAEPVPQRHLPTTAPLPASKIWVCWEMRCWRSGDGALRPWRRPPVCNEAGSGLHAVGGVFCGFGCGGDRKTIFLGSAKKWNNSRAILKWRLYCCVPQSRGQTCIWSALRKVQRDMHPRRRQGVGPCMACRQWSALTPSSPRRLPLQRQIRLSGGAAALCPHCLCRKQGGAHGEGTAENWSRQNDAIASLLVTTSDPKRSQPVVGQHRNC